MVKSRNYNQEKFLKTVGQIYIVFVEEKGKPICLICNESV